MSRSIGPYVHRKIVVLKESGGAFQAAKAMCNHRVGCILVSNDRGHMSGILTDRDLTCKLLALDLSPDTPIRDVMTADLKYVEENATIDDVVSLMAKFGIRRIPIVHELKGGFQHCIGIVTMDDLIASGEIYPEELGKIVRSQIRSHNQPCILPVEKSAGFIGEEFLKEFSATAGLSIAQAKVLAKFLFATIVRRLHYTAAVQFIAQLPHEFQEELYNLPGGPDRSIDARYLITGTNVHLRASDQEAIESIRKFWRMIKEIGDPGVLEHTLAQLPGDIREIISPDSKNQFTNQTRSTKMADKNENKKVPVRRSSFFSPVESFFEDLWQGLPAWREERFLSHSVDIEETDTEYTVCVDLPGFDKDSIKVECTGDRLSISAERSEEETHRRSSRRSYGSFYRSFTLPQGAEADQIKADYESGVLTVHIPRGEVAKSRRIEIGEKQVQAKGAAKESETGRTAH